MRGFCFVCGELKVGELEWGVGKEDVGEIRLGRELNWILIGKKFDPMAFSNLRVILSRWNDLPSSFSLSQHFIKPTPPFSKHLLPYTLHYLNTSRSNRHDRAFNHVQH
jgi:hypothetical protein